MSHYLKTFKGQSLENLETHHPFMNRMSPVVLADYVTTESGTGCVHTAPGHGLDDYLMGLNTNSIYIARLMMKVTSNDGQTLNHSSDNPYLKKKALSVMQWCGLKICAKTIASFPKNHRYQLSHAGARTQYF